MATTTYKIDKAHSEAVFQVRHLVTRVRGRFSEFDGIIMFDGMSGDGASVEFNINPASIDTNEGTRDNHLRSADFFNVDEFKTINFKSKKVTKRGSDAFDVLGDLTIRGTTKEITLPVTHLGKVKDPWGVEKLGFETEITLNRKDYGLNWNAALETGGFLVGDDVKVNLTIQAAAA